MDVGLPQTGGDRAAAGAFLDLAEAPAFTGAEDLVDGGFHKCINNDK